MSEQKKLLVLGSSAVNCKFVEAAKSLGIITYVTDISQNAPAKEIADHPLYISVFDIEALIKLCKDEGMNGIGNFTNTFSQKTQQAVAEHFSFPAYGNKEQVDILTEKKLFKQYCISHNVDVIEEYTEDDVYNDRVVYPVLVKPDDNSGSRGIQKCCDKASLLQAISEARDASNNGQFIIERFMEGCQDLTITYYIKNGIAHLISLGDRYPGREEDNLSRQLACTIQPSRYLDMYLKNVNDRVIKMLSSLGLKNGPVFMQGFADGNTVRMYDPGIRFPGNEYENVLKEATGLDVMKETVAYLTGIDYEENSDKWDGCYNLNGKTVLQYIVNAGPGTVADYTGLDEIRRLPFVTEVQQRHFVGDIVKNTGDIAHRAGEISILVDRDPDKMREAVEQVQSLLKITDTDGKNMIISAFDKTLTENYRK